MDGLVIKGSEVIEAGFEDAVLDAGIICGARRVDHYEMAAYGVGLRDRQGVGTAKHAFSLKRL